MRRYLPTALFLLALASLFANFMEFGGAGLHPKHGARLAQAAARDDVLVNAYVTGGREVLPMLGLGDRAVARAEGIYAPAFKRLETEPAVRDERSFSDVLDAPGVYRSATRRANVRATPVLIALLVLALLTRPKAVRSMQRQR